MSNYTCQTCKHYDHKEEICWSGRDIFFTENEHCCICWEEDEPVLTEQEQADIRGDRRAHRIMVEGREIK